MKKFIGLFLAAVMLCMAFQNTVYADYRIVKGYTDMGQFIYVDPELGVECRADARWAVSYIGIEVQMTAPKSDVTRMLSVEMNKTVYWAHEHGKSVGEGNVKPVAANRFGGGISVGLNLIIPPIGRNRTRFANYITTEIRFYADDVLVCECTFDKMAYAGLYND